MEFQRRAGAGRLAYGQNIETHYFRDIYDLPPPSPQLEFHPVLADTDTQVHTLAEGRGKMNWKNLLESISESVNDHLRLRNDSLVAENRILRNQIDGRIRLTDSERQELAALGARVGHEGPG